MKHVAFGALLALLSTTAGCLSDGDGYGGGGDVGEVGATPPVLENLVVNIGVDGVDPDGAFVVSENNKVFLEFGAEVAAEGGGTKILPTFEYRVRTDADVVSPMDGVITRVEFQAESNDWFIWIQSHEDADWLVEVDHILDLAEDFSAGDAVLAGDLLGKPGSWGGSLGRIELLVTDGSDYQCPFALFDPDLIDDYRARVTALMDAIEAENTTGTPFYDQENMVEPGCNEWTYSD